MGRAWRRWRPWRRAAAALALCAALLAPASAAGQRDTAEQPLCRSQRDPERARALSAALAVALAGRERAVSLLVAAPGTGVVCAHAADRRHDAASLAKVLILLATVHRAEAEQRPLTRREKARLRLMITESDNDAATALWLRLGTDRLERFLALAGARDTELGAAAYWGLTRTSARDTDRLLRQLTPGAALIRDRAPALRLLGAVRADQRWGVSAGAPATVTVRLKNGWLPRDDGSWRVHSSGLVTGGAAGPYRITVLSEGHATLEGGVAVVERLARAVHAQLAVAER